MVRAHREQNESAYDTRASAITNLRLPGDSTADLLSAAGADIIGKTTPGALSTVSLRGGAAGRSLVTIGSVPVNSGQSGVFDLSIFPSYFFSSVEIVNGGCSAVRGADAASGHLGFGLPEMPKTNRFTAGLLAGSWNKWEGDLGLSLRAGPRFGFRLAAGAHASRNLFPYTIAHVPYIRGNAGNTNLAVTASCFARFPSASSDLHVLVAGKHTGVPGDPILQNLRAHQEDRNLFILSHTAFFFPRFTEFDISWLSSEIAYKDPVPTAGDPVDSKHVNGQAFGRAGQTWDAGSWSLHYGLEARWNSILSTDIGRRTRGLLSPFASLEASPFGPRFKGSFRIRYDWSTVYRSIPSATLGIRAAVGPGFIVRSSLSSSFREPGFNNVYWPRDAFARGNPSLRPETSYNLDAGIEYSPGDSWSAQATGFITSYKDLIVWEMGSGGIWQPENMDRALYGGWEFSGNFRPIRPLEFTGRWSRILPYNMSPGFEGKFVPYVPIDRFGATASLRAGPVKSFVRWSYSGFSYTTKQNTVSASGFADPSSVLDAGLSVGLHGWSLSFSCLDILRPWSFTPRGQPVPGRNFNIELRHYHNFPFKKHS